jgi:hypothetical protein
MLELKYLVPANDNILFFTSDLGIAEEEEWLN